MVLSISGVRQLAAIASGVDKAGHAVQVDVTAYVINAGDVETAISVVEAQVLKEAVIPDGTGGFTNPTSVTATSVEPSSLLTSAPLIYRHNGPGADEKFPVTSIYAIQVLASIAFDNASATLTVYPLNSALKPSISLAKSDVMQLPVVPDPEVQGQMDKPDTVAAISGIPVSAAPLSAFILAPSAVIPNWPDAETVSIGGGGLPSADALGLKVNFVEVPNDGTHPDGDVISLNPSAGTTVPLGTLVTVTIWGRSE